MKIFNSLPNNIRILDMTRCSLKLYHVNILFIIHFIHLQNSLNIVEIIHITDILKI